MDSQCHWNERTYVKATTFALVKGKMYKAGVNCIDRGQEMRPLSRGESGDWLLTRQVGSRSTALYTDTTVKDRCPLRNAHLPPWRGERGHHL